MASVTTPGSCGEPDADDGVRSQAYGRVLGLLDAGVVLAFWAKRRANGVAELVRHRYRLDRIPSMLLRDEAIALWTTSDVARFLGLSRQRIDVLANQGRLPGPRAGERGTVLGVIDHRALGRAGVVGTRRWRQRPRSLRFAPSSDRV